MLRHKPWSLRLQNKKQGNRRVDSEFFREIFSTFYRKSKEEKTKKETNEKEKGFD